MRQLFEYLISKENKKHVSFSITKSMLKTGDIIAISDVHLTFFKREDFLEYIKFFKGKPEHRYYTSIFDNSKDDLLFCRYREGRNFDWQDMRIYKEDLTLSTPSELEDVKCIWISPKNAKYDLKEIGDISWINSELEKRTPISI